MSLKLYFHPLSSFCHKVLIALYETGTPFEPRIVDLFGEAVEYRKIAPLGKIPVLRDEAKNRTIPETSIIIEYLAQHYPGKTQLFPRTAISAGRCACATGSTTSMSTCRCRTSSPTGCVPRTTRIRSAWIRRGRR